MWVLYDFYSAYFFCDRLSDVFIYIPYGDRTAVIINYFFVRVRDGYFFFKQTKLLFVTIKQLAV